MGIHFYKSSFKQKSQVVNGLVIDGTDQLTPGQPDWGWGVLGEGREGYVVEKGGRRERW